MSTTSALSTDAHTVAARADAGSPSSEGSWRASAPARLQLPLESDSETWNDLRDDLSASSDDSSDELMSESGCSTSQILVSPHMLSQRAQQAGALKFGPGAQHAQRMSSGVAKLMSPSDIAHQHDTSACSPDAALEPEKLRTDPLGIQCLSVFVSDEVDQSSESADQLTAQHIRDRYPHLFQTFPPLAAAESSTVSMQPGTAAEPAADSSTADVLPMAMRPAAEASTAADSSLDELSAVDLTINAEALMEAGGSHMTAVPEAIQILPAALSSSSGSQRHLAESKGVTRAGQSQDALQTGLLGGGRHESALRQLLQDTNNELAIRLESGYSGTKLTAAKAGTNNNNINLLAFQLIVHARYLLGVPAGRRDCKLKLAALKLLISVFFGKLVPCLPFYMLKTFKGLGCNKLCTKPAIFRLSYQ